MCASFEIKGKRFKPRDKVRVRGKKGISEYVWAGFARKERIDWWKKKGGELVDLPAEKFAERSDVTRKLIWDEVPDGLVIRALVDNDSNEPILKIVTRAANKDEAKQFQHDRMPSLESPFYDDSFEILDIPPDVDPADLF